MQEALVAVKQELGDEAVILKTGVLPRSGVFDLLKKDMVEVIAAVDVPDSKITDWMPQKPAGKTPGRFHSDLPREPLPDPGHHLNLILRNAVTKVEACWCTSNFHVILTN